LKDTDLSVFEKKCDTLSQMCDTMDLVIKMSVGVITDISGEINVGGSASSG
jgi:hypothetical protein